MQPREKLLAGALGTIVALWFGWPLFSNTFIVPMQERADAVRRWQGTFSNREDQELLQMQAQAKLKKAKASSLPPDPLDAQRVYQEWLTDLAQLCGWENLKITLTTPDLRKTYYRIPIAIEAKAKLSQIERFLTLFAQADLLQHITRCELSSTSATGDPKLSILVNIEGVSIIDSPPRKRLFPQTTFASDVDTKATTITVQDPSELPDELPFFIRSGKEFLEVTGRNDNVLTVQRGTLGSAAEPHPAESDLELYPQIKGSKAMDGLTATRFFVKATPSVPRNPKAATTVMAPAVRGKAWKTEVKVTDWDPALGTVRFELGSDAPGEMKLNPETGAIEWIPSSTHPVGTTRTAVTVHLGATERPPLVVPIAIEVRRDNRPPTLVGIEPQVAYLGREFTLQVSAADPDLPEETLEFSLGGKPPEGATIDAKTGLIRWSPGRELSLKDQTLEIVVKDSGMPPQTANTSVVLQLRDDPLRYTRLTSGIVESGKSANRSAEAWLRDTSTDTTRVVRMNDQVTIGSLNAKVVDIHTDHIDLEIDGSISRLMLGKTFLDLIPLDPKPEPKKEP